LSERLRVGMRDAEQLTRDNDGLSLQVAVGYGGRWDIVMAARRVAEMAAQGVISPSAVDEGMFAEAMSLAGCPDPDLMIRTGGEKRISNFLLWHAAYAELHFSDVLWPDFDAEALEQAFACFSRRDRRFGRVPMLAKEEAG
jgi:undecaprenyl diphosphate synthase